MKTSQIRDVVRRALRYEYGFSPRYSDITILSVGTQRFRSRGDYEQELMVVAVSVSELVEDRGSSRVVAPKRFYRIYPDGVQIERCNEDGSVIEGGYVNGQ